MENETNLTNRDYSRQSHLIVNSKYAMKETIMSFQNNFANQLLLAPSELDFSYKKYLKEKMDTNSCDSIDDYLSFFEENVFLEREIRENILKRK